MSNLSGFVKRLRDIMRNDACINGDAQRIEQIAWLLILQKGISELQKLLRVSKIGNPLFLEIS